MLKNDALSVFFCSQSHACYNELYVAVCCVLSHCLGLTSESYFSNFQHVFGGTLTLHILFLIIEIDDFCSNLTDIWAKIKSLLWMCSMSCALGTA